MHTKFTLNNIKPFAVFALSIIDEIAWENISLLKQLNTPAVNSLLQLPPDQYFEVVKARLHNFLSTCLDDTYMSAIAETSENWKKGILPGKLEKSVVQPLDIIYGFDARKKSILKFIPRYTSDIGLALQISGELDNYNLLAEKHLFETYAHIQQEEIQLNQARFKALAEASFEGIVIHDTSKVIDFNDTAAKLFGYEKEELSGLDIYKMVPTDQLDYAKSKITSQAATPYEITALRKDGTTFPALVLGKTMHREGKDLRVTAVRDLSHEKEIEREVIEKNRILQESENKIKKAYDDLKQAKESLILVNNGLEQRVQERTEALEHINTQLEVKNRELLKINADLDNFIYTASHDLKAPIANIEGLISELKVTSIYENEDTRPVIDHINVAVEKFKNTINDLTEITKVQKNIEEDLEEVDFNKLTEEILFTHADTIRKLDAKITLNLEEAVNLEFSRRNLRSILYNLVSNALKYHHPERSPEIEIKLASDQEFVVLSVKDNGLGMRPDQSIKAFSMFKRLHDHVEGSGVGLYIVKRIIDNAGGQVAIESELNKGSIFKVYFPRKLKPIPSISQK